MSDIVVAAGLGKSFGTHRAVEGVSLSIARGSIFGVLGPNGAGKTTLLRMVMGIIDPDQGRCSVLGAARPRDVAHRVGYLPEERGLYPNMTARDMVAFMGALRGLPWAEGRRRADVRLSALGLGHASGMKVRKLSKGMAQMVQLVGALIHDPELIVLDEPFSGLDPVNQERLEALVRADRDRGATIILSTHVMAHAQRLCDELAIIAGGQRRFLGSVEQARALLPMAVRYRPRVAGHLDEMAQILPKDARLIDGEWCFALADDGVERLLSSLVAAHHGVEGLAIARPDLHDAFVHIVGEASAEKVQ
ncbi:MAG: ATP-binding cassette domain-containing protein [Sphingopyxis sp.]